MDAKELLSTDTAPIAIEELEIAEVFIKQAWEFYAKEQESIGKFISVMRRRHMLSNDGCSALLSECVSRLPDIMASYSNDHGTTLRTHVFANFKWLTYKFVHNYSAGKHGGLIHSNINAARKRCGEYVSNEQLERVRDRKFNLDKSLIEADEVQSTLAGLDSFNQALIHLRYTCELTYEDIGDYLGVNSGVARSHVIRAVDACRQFARERGITAGASDQCLDLIAELRKELRNGHNSS
jgi:sigma-70-like protein